jgi:hypothetical protein
MVNEYFLKTEGCSFEEFCNVYNNGEKIYGNLKFTNFPKDILDALIPKPEEVVPQPLFDYLSEKGLLEEFIRSGFTDHPDRMSLKSLKEAGIEAIGFAMRLRDNKWLKIHQDYGRYFNAWLDRHETYLPDAMREILKKEQAYEWYLANLPVQYKNKNHFKRHSFAEILRDRSFMWAGTLQGKSFWADICKKLEEYDNRTVLPAN